MVSKLAIFIKHKISLLEELAHENSLDHPGRRPKQTHGF
jgi:hypothetical protein